MVDELKARFWGWYSLNAKMCWATGLILPVISSEV